MAQDFGLGTKLEDSTVSGSYADVPKSYNLLAVQMALF
jgi:hypothetical protein